MILLMVLVLFGQSLYMDTVGDQDTYLHFVEEDYPPCAEPKPFSFIILEDILPETEGNRRQRARIHSTPD